MPSRLRSTYAPWALVALAVGFGLVELWPETRPVAYLNDEAFHTEMVRFAMQRLEAGHDPLTSWFSPINLGSPVYLHYQSLPSIITGAVAVGIGPLHAFEWSVYLLLSTWPITMYLGARLFGLPRWAAAAAAALAPLLSSAPGVGYEWGSYMWIGWGVWTQLWAMWVMPLAWGFSFQAITRRRHLAAAMVCDALVVCLHYLSGYIMVIPLLVVPLVALGTGHFWRFAWRSLLVGAGGLALSSWVVFPVFLQRHWAARNEFLAGTPAADSFGARKILTWLVDGQLFDRGRWPVMTVLVVVGFLACLARFRADLRARSLVLMAVVAMVAFFGKPTLGPVLHLLPGAADLFLRRFLTGLQLAALLLAGVGALVVARSARGVLEGLGDLVRLAHGRRSAPPHRRLLGPALAVVALGGLAPAWLQIARYAHSDGVDIAIQRRYDATAGVQLDRLLAIVRREGGGRVFAGEISTQLGQASRVGYVQLYTWLADEQVDSIGFTLRTSSLMANPEERFDDANVADYDVFAVPWILLPAGTTPPVAARTVATIGGYTLFRVDAPAADTAYVQVVDTQGTVSENRIDTGLQSLPQLGSSLPASGIYPTVSFAGAPAAAPTLAPGQSQSGSAGRVVTSRVRLAEGRASAEVVAFRRAVVLLKASYDPGWKVTVDGRPARTEMIAPALVGVEVAAGRHSVVFSYSGYPQYPLFFAVTALALAVIVLLPPVGRRFNRAPRREAPLTG